MEQIDKQADVQTGKQARQQVEQTNAQAVELQEQANGDIPAMSPRLENVETDLQNDSDVYTETWEENGYKFRYTDLTRRANRQIRRRPDVQTDEQLEEQIIWLISILEENGFEEFLRAGQAPEQAVE